jgi:predicted nucleotidyltransferase
MPSMQETDRQKLLSAACDELLAALPDAWAIYVYGSFARGDEWPDSDVDLAVLLPPLRVIADPLELIARISTRIGREVDVVDLRRSSDLLRREVLESGRALFVSDPERVLDWESTALSRYARHREEIAGILRDFEDTGIGYGR